MSDRARIRQAVLGIDAATPPASVAVVRDDELLAARTGPFGRDTDAWILPAIDEVLAEASLRLADLARIGVSIGPGTFTGIRVGMATAMGLARGAALHVTGVTTLEAIALAAVGAGSGRVLATVDARRSQVYAAIHDVANGRVATVREAWIATPGEVAGLAREYPGVLAAGTGLTAPELAHLGVLDNPAAPLAAAVARLASQACVDPAAGLLPFYLRGAGARPSRGARPAL